jgi:hypothetical protein
VLAVASPALKSAAEAITNSEIPLSHGHCIPEVRFMIFVPVKPLRVRLDESVPEPSAASTQVITKSLDPDLKSRFK